MKRFFTTSEVAEVCGITRDGVHKARIRGKFPHVKKLKDARGEWYRYPRCDVKEFLFVERGIRLEDMEGGNEDG